jgi:ABC-type multidrug transport system ATPase subunit
MQDMNTATMVTISAGAVRRGGRSVLDSFSIDVPRHSVVGLVGINGAGKSSLMLQLCGMLKGAPQPPHPVGYAPQRPSFPEWLDPREAAALFGQDLNELARRFAGLLLHELAPLKRGTMSVGQAQALSVALALALQAPLTLLDEPFAPLDFRRRIGLTCLLNGRSADTGGVVVVSSQSAAELINVCSWVVVLSGGRCVYAGPIDGLAGSAIEDSDRRRDCLEQRILALLEASG